VVFTNGAGGADPGGAVVAAIWPRDAVIAERAERRPALGPNPRFERNTAQGI